VEFKARQDRSNSPESFRFGAAKDPATKVVYQRYSDADMVEAQQEVALEQQYGGRSMAWLWWLGGGGVALVGAAVGLLLWLRKPNKTNEVRWTLPEPLTPFTTIGLLEKIHHEGKLTEEQREQLRKSIHQVERCYFASESNGDGRVDLRTIAEGWVSRAG
jgi:hypothetical protein